ncbi:MAG: rane protein insertase, YidC/Oxa1 family [Frankiales bacterium]|nr:rane protein insertase, YidC/Oxa1 family [Frankiales bacterium]
MFSFLATPVALILKTIHSLLTSAGLPSGSGWAWGLSIVLLTMTVRLVLFPLFVKQIRSQRRMQEIAPKVKELQKLHKGDRETLNTEMMKLYKEHGANPISGCAPLVLQLPVFFALFRVMREFKPNATPKYGLSAQLLSEGGRAKVLGAPLSAAFNSPASLLQELDAKAIVVRLVAALMVIGMGASTFYTQKQMMARAGANADPQQAMVQKTMLYVLPLSFAFSGVFFPVGVLLYWLTTNVWSMGQQAYVIKRMPPVGSAAAASPKGTSGGVDLGKSTGGTALATPAGSGSVAVATPPPAPKPGTPTGKASGSRKNKKRPRGGRR